MPKDPKRNIQSYQIQGGHLNEFEYQKNQSEMADEPNLPFTEAPDQSNLNQAKRVATVTAEAHRKVEQRKKRGLAKAGSRSSATVKPSSKKVTRKSTKKTTARVGTKKRAQVAGSKRSSKTVGRKSPKKTMTSAGRKKRGTAKKAAANRSRS